MLIRRVWVTLGVMVLVVTLMRLELYTVQRPGDQPLPLRLIPVSRREAASFDVVLPCVPIGTRRLASGSGVMLVHDWAPWQRDGASQAARLDSLVHLPRFAGLEGVIVCSDPFPSVARYVARRRIKIPVLLDGPGRLKQRLPCPSIPFTYVLDSMGRIAVRQPGQVDWESPDTGATLDTLLLESPGD